MDWTKTPWTKRRWTKTGRTIDCIKTKPIYFVNYANQMDRLSSSSGRNQSNSLIYLDNQIIDWINININKY